MYKHVQACDVKFELCLKQPLILTHPDTHTHAHTHTRTHLAVLSHLPVSVSPSRTHCALSTGVNHSRSAHTGALRRAMASHNNLINNLIPLFQRMKRKNEMTVETEDDRGRKNGGKRKEVRDKRTERERRMKAERQ